VVVGVTWTVASGFADGRDTTFLLVHALSTLPFLPCAALLTWGALRRAPASYRRFWRDWLVATCLATLAALSAIVGVVADSRAFVALDVAFMVAAAPFWTVATFRMLRLLAGRLSISIDLVDGLMALLVLGAPWLLVLAEPMGEADERLFAIPFAVVTVVAPAGLYLAFVELYRVPAGQRAPHAIGLALGAAFTVSVTLQLANVVTEVDLPAPVFVALHVLVMGLVMEVPLWAASADAVPVTPRPPEQESRHAGPMPAVAAVVLPLLAAYVFATRDDRPWGVPFLVVIVLGVVALNAVRHTAMARETRRLHAGLAAASEERGRLLAAMLRALEEDRHRTATELHSQAVGSLTTLGTIIQTAAVTLPPATATAVTDTIAGLQGDLTDRAEELRQLMVAMRAPAFPEASPGAGAGAATGGTAGRGDEALGAALRAYAAELVRDRPGPVVCVEVQPGLHLDWSTMTIAYRVAQEAVSNAARHARALSVEVRVSAAGSGVLVEVRDDGCGFEPGRAAPGSGLATMELFASLGRGELAAESTPGRGTVVRCLLGTRPARTPPPTPRHGRRHLHAVPGPVTG
jgi:signal transduction histidine kinase